MTSPCGARLHGCGDGGFNRRDADDAEEHQQELSGLFVRIIREMQSRSGLNYYPNGVDAGGWHTLDVRVPGKSVAVVARRGYWRR